MVKESNVLFLDKGRLDFYSDKQGKVYSIDLTSISSNLEITDKNLLTEQIKSFVEQTKIPPGNIAMILSESILFAKGLPPKIEDEDDAVQKFVDSVPFEHIGVKTYPIEGGKLVVAANRDFYESVKEAFEKCDFFVNIVVPIYSSGTTIPENSPMNDTTAKIILKNTEFLRQNSLEIYEEKHPIIQSTRDAKPEKKRERILIAIFGLLILILIIVVISSLRSQPTPIKKPVIVNTAGTSPTTAPLESASASSTLKIKLTGTEAAAPKILVLKGDLTASGFNDLSESQSSSQSASSVIQFVPSVPVDQRTQIAQIVSRVSNNFSIQESQNTDSDVTIFLAN